MIKLKFTDNSGDIEVIVSKNKKFTLTKEHMETWEKVEITEVKK